MLVGWNLSALLSLPQNVGLTMCGAVNAVVQVEHAPATCCW